MSVKIGYKLFRIKKSEPGKLFPLFVKANKSLPIGEWVNAEYGEPAGEGKVKSKLGPLKFRPGFHINDIAPYVSHIGEKVNGVITYMKPDTVWCEVEYHTDVDYSNQAKLKGMVNNKFFSIKACLDYIPVGGFYKYKTSPSMFGEWIISGEMKILRILTDEQVKEICKNANCPYLPRRYEMNLSEYGFAA